MDKLVNVLEKYVLPFSIKLGKQKHLSAIKNGFIKLMPLSLIGAMFVLLNNVFLNFSQGSFFYQMGVRLEPDMIDKIASFQAIGNNALQGTLSIIALMTPLAIGSCMAAEREVDEWTAGLISIATFMVVTPFITPIDYTGIDQNIVDVLPIMNSGISPSWFGGANVISGMIIGIFVGELYSFIVKKNLVIKMPSSVPPNVSKSFSAIIPGTIVLSIFGLLAWILASYGTSFHQIMNDLIAQPLSNAGDLVGITYVFFSAFLWFFGVHGSLALSALDSGVMTPLALENVDLYTQYGSVDAAILAGEQFNLWAKPMIDSYIYLGGTGATLGLIIAIFIGSKRQDYRSVAKLSLPSGLFQINEPILFGLPIIMNPIFLIPYICVQPILALITTIAYNIGFIPPVTNLAPWTMPVGLGAFFNSNGSISALFLALFNLMIATIIYLPFVITANKQQEIENEVKIQTKEEIIESLMF